MLCNTFFHFYAKISFKAHPDKQPITSMRIGYARHFQPVNATPQPSPALKLEAAGVAPEHIHQDIITNSQTPQRALNECIAQLSGGDTLVITRLDQLGKDMYQLITLMKSLRQRGVDLQVLEGEGAKIDISKKDGELMLDVFSALGEYERVSERKSNTTQRSRGRRGGRKFALNKEQIKKAARSMANPNTVVSDLCRELGVTRATLYRYVGPNGELRTYAQKVLQKAR